MNAPPVDRETSGSPLEGGEDYFFGHLNSKSLAQTCVTSYFATVLVLTMLFYQILQSTLVAPEQAEARSTKQILMTKIPMTKTVTPLTAAK